MRILIHTLTIVMFLSLTACMDFGLLGNVLGDAADGFEQGLAGERDDDDTAEDWDTGEDWDTAEDELEHRCDDRDGRRPRRGEDDGDGHEDDCEDHERPPRPHGPDCDEDDDDLDTGDEDEDEDEDEEDEEDED